MRIGCDGVKEAFPGRTVHQKGSSARGTDQDLGMVIYRFVIIHGPHVPDHCIGHVRDFGCLQVPIDFLYAVGRVVEIQDHHHIVSPDDYFPRKLRV
ncbi:hypothetical protein SDC9_110868 [bioreactor metagenome]|uniref:Uncharacterized protein n=1 Tax=bioreactor metagenome TaxID=1076179 RepID=A0A645BL75_9ZZZZ